MLALPIALAMVGCASAPTQEMSDARQAIGSARTAQAPSDAPRAFARAVAHLDDASHALETGAYDRARSDALAAKHDAIEARELATAIGEARRAVARARARGDSVEEAAAMLGDAEAAARAGDEATAMRLAREIARQLR